MFENVKRVLNRFEKVKRLNDPTELTVEGFAFQAILGRKRKGQFKRLLDKENEFHTYTLEGEVPKKLTSSEIVLRPLETRVHLNHETGLTRMLFTGREPEGIKTSFDDINGIEDQEHCFSASGDAREQIDISKKNLIIGRLLFKDGKLTEVQVDHPSHLLKALEAIRKGLE